MIPKRATPWFLMSTALCCLGACGGSSSSAPPPIQQTGKVVGTIVTKSGNALDQYAAVLFTPTTSGQPVSVKANTNGAYQADLRAGNYTVTVTRPGYAEEAGTAIAVTAGVTKVADFALPALPANTYIGSVGWSWNGSNISWDAWRSYGHDDSGSYTP